MNRPDHTRGRHAAADALDGLIHVRPLQMGKGRPHDEVEQRLTTNAKMHPLVALELLDDEQKTSEVLPRLNRLGAWAADVFKDCKEGAPEQYSGDLTVLIDDAKRLAAHVRGR